ncbi:phospholipase D-like domain-containing protein [Dyella silvatica]|uniref:phospholipase D-like domain-containing protein n=1 Tax=Dyella silvatica TaxID=2992128 RepID=UPI00225A8E8E|nr:phospholipase D-like domain-containing protein [Dyella silvatica]
MSTNAFAEAANATTQTLVIEPDQGLTPIYNLIQSAKSSIDMTMYELADTQAQTLLDQAAANGIRVRVILDQNLEYNNNLAAYNDLNSHGVQVVWAQTKYAATHQKSIVIDNTTAAVMSLNFTSRYYSTSRDYAVIENDPSDVAAIESTFSADFNAQSITPPVGDDLVWSPTNSKTSLVNLINSAQSSLLIENEEMSYSTIVTALVNAANRGVSVTVCMTDSSSWTSNFDKLAAAGVKISTYASSAPLYIHAKAIVADYGTANAKAFVGSENFSSYSLTRNRELGLITTNASILSQLNTTISNDYAGGTPW